MSSFYRNCASYGYAVIQTDAPPKWPVSVDKANGVFISISFPFAKTSTLNRIVLETEAFLKKEVSSDICEVKEFITPNNSANDRVFAAILIKDRKDVNALYAEAKNFCTRLLGDTPFSKRPLWSKEGSREDFRL